MDISFTPSQATPTLSSQSPSGFSSSNYTTRKPNGSIDWLNVVLMLIAGVSILVTVILFIWHTLLLSSISAKKVKLSGYESSLSQIPLQEIKKVSTKLKLANSLAREYPYVTNIFQILEDSVDTNVTFSSFDMHYDIDKNTYIVSVLGIAPDYKTVARQMDLLRSSVYSTYVTNLSLQSLRPNSNGGVDFAIKMNIGVIGIAPDMLILSSASTTVRGGTVSELVASSSPQINIASSSPATGGSSGKLAPHP